MNLLIVKLSSLGDVVHTFPALTDAACAVPGLRVGWAVEEAFVPLVRLHPAVSTVIPVPLRRMLKKPGTIPAEFPPMLRRLRAERYDLVIDAQGLAKSAVVARLARARARHGFARGSAREGIAALAYDRGHDIPEIEHMGIRIRKLFAAALGYPLPGTPADPGLVTPAAASGRPYLVLLHGTTAPAKEWTVEGWRGVAARAGEAGFDVVVLAHGAQEMARAEAIAAGHPHVRIAPPAGLDGIAAVIGAAAGAISVDTGLGHLAAAYGVPTVGLYGPTDPRLTGLIGPRVTELVSPRGAVDHAPDDVWSAFTRLAAA